jgi:hypothetical protein|tara:strand:- start:1916 stop:2602 length:687 start_codon:yes stop_codon:yes gene_type:complete
MFNKKITFCATNKEMLDIWPHPKPASRFVPKEYKKLERFENKNLFAPTVKTCMPFLDSMTAGYIIAFDQDYLVNPIENEFTVVPANKEESDFGYHSKAQLPKEWHKTTGEAAGKFINKWLIKTPPGYSCLFIHPMNRLEERWKIIEGVVDTDNYVNVINFPFVLKKRDEQFLIKKGEPMVQIIPFKRESWKMWSGFYMEKLHSKTINILNSEWVDRYKNIFWSKKKFK